MDFHHGVDYCVRSAGIAYAEASHRKRLAHTAEKNRALLHAWQRGNGSRAWNITEFLVDFVTDDKKVVPDCKVGEFLLVFKCQSRACRIVWIIQQQDARPRRDIRLQVVDVNNEIVFLESLDGNWNAKSHFDFGRIRDITWLVVEHFVAWIQHGAHQNVQRFADADRDDAFRFRRI